MSSKPMPLDIPVGFFDPMYKDILVSEQVYKNDWEIDYNSSY